MAEEKRAELYTSPGGKFIRADTLTRILAHWRSFRAPQKQSHFIKYDGELYAGVRSQTSSSFRARQLEQFDVKSMPFLWSRA